LEKDFNDKTKFTANTALALWRLKELTPAVNIKSTSVRAESFQFSFCIYNQLYIFKQRWFRREGILVSPQTPMLQRCARFAIIHNI